MGKNKNLTRIIIAGFVYFSCSLFSMETGIAGVLKRAVSQTAGDMFATKYEWYNKLREPLKKIFPAKKEFHFPAPEIGLPQLIKHYVKGQLKDKYWVLLQEGIIGSNSDSIYTAVISALKSSDPKRTTGGKEEKVDGDKHATVIRLIQRWSMSNGRPHEWLDIYLRNLSETFLGHKAQLCFPENLSDPNLYAGIVKDVNELQESPFKEWAQTVIAAWDSTTLEQYFEQRKKLTQIHAEHNEIPGNIPFLDTFRGPYTAIDDECPQQEPSIIKFVSRWLHRSQLHDDVLFGFASHYEPDGHFFNAFYAFDSNDGHIIWTIRLKAQEAYYSFDSYYGHIIWSTPLESQGANGQPFVVRTNFVYCVEGNSILQINRQTGSIIKTLNTKTHGRIIDICATADDFLFVLYDTYKLCIVNVHDESDHNYIVLKLPETVNPIHHYFFDDRMTFQTITKTREPAILIIDKQGVRQEFPLQEYCPHIIQRLQNNRHVIWHQSTKGKNIICSDINSGQQIYELSLPSPLIEMKLSNKGDRLYLLTTGECAVLDISTLPEKSPKLLWTSPIFELAGASILNSDDDTSLYIFFMDKKRCHFLLKYDCQKGTFEFLSLDAINFKRCSHIAGVHKGKLYCSFGKQA